MKYWLAILTCVLLLPAARAQTVERLAAYEHLKPLEWLIGDWVGDFTLPYDLAPFKKGDRVEYQVSYRWAQNRNYILVDGAMVKDGRRAPDSHEAIIWFPKHKKLVQVIFNSFGIGEGEWTEVGKKARQACTLAGGTAVAFMESVDPDTHTWQVKEIVLKDEKLPDWPKVTFKRKTGVAAGDLWDACQQKVFSGTWQGNGELINGSPDGKLRKGDKFEMRIAYTPVLGGKAATADLEFRVPARSVESKGRGLVGWDPESRQVRLLAHWDDGGVEEVVLTRQQGETLFGSYSGRNPGRPTLRGPARMDLGDDGKSLVYRMLDGRVLSTWKRVDK